MHRLREARNRMFEMKKKALPGGRGQTVSTPGFSPTCIRRGETTKIKPQRQKKGLQKINIFIPLFSFNVTVLCLVAASQIQVHFVRGTFGREAFRGAAYRGILIWGLEFGDFQNKNLPPAAWEGRGMVTEPVGVENVHNGLHSDRDRCDARTSLVRNRVRVRVAELISVYGIRLSFLLY